MRRLLWTFSLLFFLFVGGWLLLNMDKIQSPKDILRLVGHQFSGLGAGAQSQNAPWRMRTDYLVRIGSFNANGLTEQRLKDPRVKTVVTDIIRQFDIIAVQEINTKDTFAIKRFLKTINSTGRNFKAILGNRSGGQDNEGLAFLYDASTIELQDGQHYHVNDPDNVMQRDPLVAWFRTRVQERNAFTFTLVNVHLQRQADKDEMSRVSQIFRAVRNDGRVEDDVILIGDFGVDSQMLNRQVVAQGLQAINSDQSTSTRTTTQTDNIMLDPLATGEFTGDNGVFDFLKAYNLSLNEALQVSDHMPVWGEFSVFENSGMGQIANSQEQENRRR